MNLPNSLTLSRIVLAAVLVLLLQEHSLGGHIWAVIVFAIASLTDFFDGHLAKSRGLISDFGKIMDPIADKVLILSVFGMLAHMGLIAWWMFAVIAAREVGVTIDRLYAMRRGLVLPAERAGKIKTVAQMIAASSLLLYLVAGQFEGPINWWVWINDCLMLTAVILTVYSGIEYLRRNKMKNSLMKAFATVLGVGFLPAVPGTWATIVGVVIAYYSSSNMVFYSILMLVLLALGVMATGTVAEQMGQKDPGCLCIDEVVGVMIALWGLPTMWPIMICGFFLFRAFDMFKIYPINRLEDFHGGWGIMLDDCMAGVYTNIILRIALRCAGLF